MSDPTDVSNIEKWAGVICPQRDISSIATWPTATKKALITLCAFEYNVFHESIDLSDEQVEKIQCIDDLKRTINLIML